MEKEMLVGQFEAVEQKVEKLLEAYKDIKATNSALLNKIGQLEAELQSKIEAESRYDQERVAVRSKIDELLVRIQNVTEAS